ncbi:MAG: hypothetical protein R2764_03645 [Bacteroidales bacterium]
MKKNFSDWKYVIIAIFVIVGVIFLIRIFYLQVINDSYFLSAENNVLRQTTIYPNRGLIFDWNENIMVFDEAAL